MEKIAGKWGKRCQAPFLPSADAARYTRYSVSSRGEEEKLGMEDGKRCQAPNLPSADATRYTRYSVSQEKCRSRGGWRTDKKILEFPGGGDQRVKFKFVPSKMPHGSRNMRTRTTFTSAGTSGINKCRAGAPQPDSSSFFWQAAARPSTGISREKQEWGVRS